MQDRYKISGTIKIKPQMIIVHWTAVDSAEKSFNAFNRETLLSQRKDLDSSSLNVSIHFLVDKEGNIFRLMPENRMARHCVGLNHLAIGIENVGGVGGKEDLTKAQLQANAKLIKHLKEKYSTIRYLIGHYEYLQFENTSLWKEKKSTIRTKKIDPGKIFMKDLRNSLKKYNFLPQQKGIKK
jgi:N-acetyl-anhydromuramyl-L-alanine amidase AmpD